MDINDIFESEIQGANLDQDISTSAVVLQKLAESVGVDLDSLPVDDVEAMLSKLSGNEPEPNQTKEAEAMSEITNIDVALELQKIAIREGVDLATVDKETYQAVWDKVAHDMQQPDYAEKVAAEEAVAAEKRAAYETGVEIARGFVESVNAAFSKEAADAPPFAKKDDEEDDEGKKKEKEKEKEEKTAAGTMAGGHGAPDGTKTMVGAKDTARKLIDKAKGMSGKHKALAAGALAAAGAGAAGAGYLATRGKKKEASEIDEIEELAVKIARQHIIDAGFDPDTSEPLNAEQAKIAAAEKRAAELLQENGWL